MGSRSFKVIEFGTNRTGLLLATNSNFGCKLILHAFRVIRRRIHTIVSLLGVMLWCEYIDELHILWNYLQSATFLSQTVYAHLPSAWCGKPRNLTEVAKNCKKDTLCGFEVVQGHWFCHKSKSHVRLSISC